MAAQGADGAAGAAERGSDREQQKEERIPLPSRNPIPLSASQEAQVRDVFFARVRRHCADEIKGVFSPIVPTGQKKFSMTNRVQPSQTAPSAAPFPCPSSAASRIAS